MGLIDLLFGVESIRVEDSGTADEEKSKSSKSDKS